MVLQTQAKPITFEEFRDYVLQPDNAERSFELINGEMIEKMPGTTLNSAIPVNIAFHTRLHCRDKGIPCYISTGDGAYRIGNNVVAPDMAYKQSPMSDEYPDPIAPVWAVEVISTNDKAYDIRKKRQVYQEAGILLWEIYPELLSVDVYAPGQSPNTFQIGEMLTVENVLSDFAISVKAIFEN
ncbi:MAG: Uma2 family endonuclease [Anaerolineae bacterium]|nr:Uma2 family endonuclease [Anaerolineae bacterium]